MTTTALHTPVVASQGSRHGRLYRKEILRKGRINYEGQLVDIDDALCGEIRRAFDEKAFDQAAVQLADAQNTHTEDPERFRGEVVALEETPQSLFALVSLSEEGQKVVDANPNLGVSARIVRDHRRIDGKSWPAALGHLLMTINPRMTGMGPWTQVALAHPEIPVVDLTSATYQQGAPMETSTQTPPAAGAGNPDDTGDLTEEEWEALMRSAEEYETAPPTIESPATPTSLSVPAQLGQVDLSPQALAAIELANTQVASANARIAALEAQNRQQRWEIERDTYIAAGVPPHLVELAAGVLNAPIDLSNGASPSATVVRQMLDGMKGLIDFGVIGTSEQLTEDDATKAFVDTFIDQYGGM